MWRLKKKEENASDKDSYSDIKLSCSFLALAEDAYGCQEVMAKSESEDSMG